ncbi:MAG: prepilin-type N-terminal cleavage/methylation domain-containing protein [Phycisphaerales bacterium]
MQNTTRHIAAHCATARRGAFTLIELLVVIVVLALLVGIAGAVYTGALSGSRRAATEQFMRNISVAIEQFESDFGYIPPLLAPDEMVTSQQGWESTSTQPELDEFEFVDPLAQADPNTALRNARYMSTLSLPLYLVGVGELAPVDYQPDDDDNRHDGFAGPGIRNPGADKAWGGARVRDLDTHRPAFTGRSYGPYMDVGAGRNWRRNGDFRAHARLENEELLTTAELGDPQVREFWTFEDRWGTPIRYYRTWPTRDRDNPSKRTIDRIPLELFSASTVQGNLDGDGDFDVAQALDLLNAKYALLSAGPDGAFADSGSPTDNEGILAGSLDESYDAADFVSTLKGGNPQQFQNLVQSVSDNIRVLP